MADYSDPLGLLFGNMDWMNPAQKSKGLLQLTPQEIERMAAAQSPAFGVFPQMQPYRSQQDITASANVPVDVARGRVAGTLGLFGDVFNQPIPMVRPLQLLSQAMTGEQKYPDTEYFLENLPLKSDTPVGDVANRVGSFAPINPMPAVRGAQKLGGLLGEEMATRLNTGRPILPSLLSEPQTAMFAVNPAEQAMTSGLLQAEVSPLGFYSAVEQQALKIPRKQGTGESFLNDLLKGQDVKKYEIEAMGLDTYLKGKPNVTRQEVQDFIQNNKINVQEKQLGNAEPFDAQRLSQLESEYKALKQHPIDDQLFGEEKYDEMIRLMNIRDQSTTDSLYRMADSAMRAAQRAQSKGMNITAKKYFREAELYNTRAEKLDLQGQGMQNPPRYEKYQFAGGENYRELLLTLPEAKPNPLAEIQQKTKRLEAMKELQAEFVAAGDIEKANSFAVKANDLEASIKELQTLPIPQQTRNYKSSHWNDPNVLAHLRVNDRIDADGKKMLLIEEVQSDWHQAGREQGYDTLERRMEKETALNNLLTERSRLLDEQQRLEELAKPFTSIGKDAPANIIDEWSIVSNRLQNLQSEQNRLGRTSIEGVPDAPFKDTWYQLALKRAIKEAVDKGYDRIGLTTGAQQASRYDLSKQVDEVIAKRNSDGSFNLDATMVGGGSQQSIGKNIPAEKLPEYVGKDLAKSMQTQETGTDVYSGNDLKVGGEGMKKYYDEIYPNFLNKYGKKYGASVGETRIKTGRGVQGGEKVRYLDITPEMKKAVQKGQPLASVEGMTGLLA